MKNMTLKVTGLAIAIFLALPAISMAQTMGQGMGQSTGMSQSNGQMSAPPNQQQAPPDTKQAAPATAGAPVLDPKEEEAFKKVSSMSMAKPDEVAKAGESFAKTYPKSNHLQTVYSILATAYMQLNDQNNLMKYGRLTLQMNPDNIDGLAVMTVSTARTIDPAQKTDAANKEKMVDDWGGRCIKALQELIKPDGVTDADFARSRDGKLALCYSGLGLSAYYEGKAAEAVKDFSMATKLEGPQADPVDLLLLGVALTATKQYPEATTALQACIKDGDPGMTTRCQDQLNEVKKLAKQ
jgi:tetratricopeptide (TPR) repeat protein